MAEVKELSNGEQTEIEPRVVATSNKQKWRSGIIKNKLRRQLLHQKERLRKARERRERKEDRKRKAEELGEEVKIRVQKKYLCLYCANHYKRQSLLVIISKIL